MSHDLWACLALFIAGYALNMSYMSVFYHRGLTHGALTLQPWLRRLVATTGHWVTGLDPKVWACLHRQHHIHSDGPLDPHSPVNVGILGVFKAQADAYGRAKEGLLAGDPAYTALVKDLDFPLSPFTRAEGIIPHFLPHLILSGVGISIAAITGAWVAVGAFMAGLMSHPIQGWLVNSFGHARGYRSYDTHDHSRNNTWVALAAFGEGYQNNHHHAPGNPHFAHQPWEFDAGYFFVRGFALVGLLSLPRHQRSLILWPRSSPPRFRSLLPGR